MLSGHPSLHAPQITLQTRDVFIECTATDLAKARVVLNTLVAMFSEHCARPFEVEPVEVVDAFGESHGARPRIRPDLGPYLCSSRLSEGHHAKEPSRWVAGS